ncbi:hypothetical protein [Trinickia sp.]|uniref:hypothetical protein n=1 Tax=Trinickia sp. TaxID=2571163 RepID=UPI002D7FBA66|nr:hypothetical protein [Trinickia sp.]
MRIEEKFNADKTLLVNVRPPMVHADTFDSERIVRVVFHPATRGKQIDPRKLAMHMSADEAREFARQLIEAADDLSI